MVVAETGFGNGLLGILSSVTHGSMDGFLMDLTVVLVTQASGDDVDAERFDGCVEACFC